MIWEDTDEYLHGIYGGIAVPKEYEKVAGFDLDDTLITTKSGHKFPKDSTDWQFQYDEYVVENKIRKLFKQNFKIIIFTNQKGLKNTQKINDWKIKMENILKVINLPIEVYVSLCDGIYRKPMPTFWHMATNRNNHEESFYCGDMAGRNRDHSDTDLKFAINNKIKFLAPEEFFLDQEVEYPKLSLKKHEKQLSEYISSKYNFKPIKSGNEIVIMVGIQGSGKSTFVEKQIAPHDYKIISSDKTKNKSKLIKDTEKLMKDNENIVIDNTNPDKESREPFIELAKKYKYKIRCVVMKIPIEIAKHNMGYRTYKGIAQYIPEIAYRIFNKKYQEPELDEGIDKIIEIDKLDCDEKMFKREYNMFFN